MTTHRKCSACGKLIEEPASTLDDKNCVVHICVEVKEIKKSVFTQNGVLLKEDHDICTDCWRGKFMPLFAKGVFDRGWRDELHDELNSTG